ncbi:MAG: zinc-dependent metalloprotease, partial [Calditrichaeota bacterium]|nr:zinc-dependent metalloprotease [Calditrichota bacterium]
AYAEGIGAWDKIAIAYGYQDFPEGKPEAGALEEILQSGIRQGLYFMSDNDARPPGGAHPEAHLWDNGRDAGGELLRVLKVREKALLQFGEKNIPPGKPMAALEEALVPVYFFHRYQLEAAVKLLGGLSYRYALRGDGQPVSEMVPPETQRRALRALLQTLQPEALKLPENLLAQIPPRAFGMSRSPEIIRTHTGLTFDALAAAEAAANLTVTLLLHPERAARLVEYHARQSDYPGLEEVVDALLEATWFTPAEPGYSGEICRTVAYVVLYRLMQLARDERASAKTKALAEFKLSEMRSRLMKGKRRKFAGRRWKVDY